MDPEATLQTLSHAVKARKYGEAVTALNNYYRWRILGGFQPMNGDTRADGLANELADALEA
jgi:hypothetical protein